MHELPQLPLAPSTDGGAFAGSHRAPEDPTDRKGGRFRKLAFPIVVTVAIVGIGLTAMLWYRSFAVAYRLEIERQLVSIADLKVDDLVRYRKERLEDARLLILNVHFSNLVRKFLAAPGDRDAKDLVEAWLKTYSGIKSYCWVRLLDTKGEPVLSLPLRDGVVAISPLPAAAVAAVPGTEPSLLDFRISEPDGMAVLDVVAPLLDVREPATPLGFVDLSVDPASHLYPFLARWPMPSASAETLLVRREGDDVLFLNPLRFDSAAALRRRAPLATPALPAAKAALGLEGIVEGEDYRRVPVLAALRTVPGSPWHMVSRIDQSEYQGPLRERMTLTLVALAALLVAWLASFYTIRRSQQMALLVANARLSEVRRKNAEQLEVLVSQATGPILTLDWRGRVSRFNRAFEVAAGRDAREALGRDLSFLFPPAEAEEGVRTILRGAETGEREAFELPIQRPDGSVRHLLWSASALPGESGPFAAGSFIQAQDITDRIRSELALGANAVELKNRADELMRFTYAVSHDLRSPLVTIKAFLGYLEADVKAGSAAAIDKDFEFIRAASAKMARLLQDLLDLARIGHTESVMSGISLKSLVDEALLLVAGRLHLEGTQVVLTPEPWTVTCDHDRLLEVFQNLLDNAGKFRGAQAHHQVSIGVDSSGPEPVIFVSDNGVGVEPRFLPKLFGMFEKLDASIEGSGVGLALVQRIVEVHGGRIWAESAGPGLGTTIRFTLAGTRRTAVQGG